MLTVRVVDGVVNIRERGSKQNVWQPEGYGKGLALKTPANAVFAYYRSLDNPS